MHYYSVSCLVISRRKVTAAASLIFLPALFSAAFSLLTVLAVRLFGILRDSPGFSRILWDSLGFSAALWGHSLTDIFSEDSFSGTLSALRWAQERVRIS